MVALSCGSCVLPPKSAGETQASGSTTTIATSTSSPSSPASTGPADELDSTSPTLPSSSSGQPGQTCRDAIGCMVECALEAADQIPPQDCVLACEEDMPPDELMALFVLTECVTDQCVDAGACDPLVPTTSTGEPGTSTGEPGTSTGTSTGHEVSPEMQCSMCVLANLLDSQPPGCLAQADACM